MNDQAELFPEMECVDLSAGMTARSTRRKSHRQKSDRFYKTIKLNQGLINHGLLKNNDRLCKPHR